MPYIKQDQRNKVDSYIQDIVDHLARSYTNEAKLGILNYIITNLLVQSLQPQRYSDYASLIGVVETLKMEVYRKLVSQFEDNAIARNGDLEIFEDISLNK